MTSDTAQASRNTVLLSVCGLSPCPLRGIVREMPDTAEIQAIEGAASMADPVVLEVFTDYV